MTFVQYDDAFHGSRCRCLYELEPVVPPAKARLRELNAAAALTHALPRHRLAHVVVVQVEEAREVPLPTQLPQNGVPIVEDDRGATGQEAQRAQRD